MQNLWRTILDADPYWNIGAWTLLIAGILLLIYALFRDRPGLFGIPRERCTRCRYDMTGTAGPTDEQPEITCPECGRSFASRKPLRKARRHWKLAALALLLMLGRYAAIHKDRIRAYGWHELIPTAVVVFWIDPERWFEIFIMASDAQPKWTDEILYRVEERLDVSAGWERDVWLHRLGPVLDEQGTWRIFNIGDLTDFQIKFISESRGGNPWPRTGPVIAWPFDSLLEDLTDVMMIAINYDNWVYTGGYTQWWFTTGDRLLVHAPQSALDKIDLLFDELRRPAEMPKSTDAVLQFDEMWALRFPLRQLAESDPKGAIADISSTAYFDDRSSTTRIREAFMSLIQTDEWVDYGGYEHRAIVWKGELWILSTKDIRQQVIDAAHRIAAEGADKILKDQAED